MNIISRQAYNELKKAALTRKLKKAEKMLMDQYNEERGPRLLGFLASKMGLSTVLEHLEDHFGQPSFRSDCLWHLAANGDSHMVITGLNMNTYDKLEDFVHREIHTSVNEQQANIF